MLFVNIEDFKAHLRKDCGCDDRGVAHIMSNAELAIEFYELWRSCLRAQAHLEKAKASVQRMRKLVGYEP